MPDVQCFTSASFSYLDRVRVLGETLRRHHPDWNFTLCLVDEAPPGFVLDLAREPIDRVVGLDQLGIPDLRGWIFQHDLVELCTAVKGAMLCKLLDEGAEAVVYLDPDIALFDTLAPAIEALDGASVVLTPHQLEPEDDRAAVIDNEIGSLKHGIYNLGFLAVRGCAEGRRFAAWWRDRLAEFCFDDIPNGLFTDQRWCDLAPAFFPGVRILRDPGCNVASWNLGRRPLTIDADGRLLAQGRSLRFFHFTKISHVGQVMLERYAGDSVTVFELVKWYLGRLEANAADGVPPGWWAFARYSDGSLVAPEERMKLRTRADLRRAIPDPFAERRAVQSA